MRSEEIRKLLGGYATGTLTEAEQQALFQAALEDQALFDALAREEPLRDLLRDPAARAHLLAALEPPPRRSWWSWRPVAAVAAMAAVATVAVVMARRPRPVLLSQALPPAATIPAAPPAAAAAEPPRPAVRPRRKPAPKAPPPVPVPAPAVLSAAAAPKAEGSVKDETAAKPAEARVEVTAAAPPVFSARTSLLATENQATPLRLAQPGARQIFFGTAQRALAARAVVGGLAPPAGLALRYTILRQDAAGAFAEADRTSLAAGDTVELRFTANTAGYLAVGDATPVALTAMQPYTTAALPPLPAEVKIVFAPQPQREAPAGAPITEVQYRDTYVANRLPGQPLTFTIQLP